MKILIADDDKTTRRLLRGTLSLWGYEVVEVDSGEAAWDHFQGESSAQLAIVDWMMPGMTGPELCRRLKTLDRKPPPYVILLTAKSDCQDLVEGLNAGADEYVTKPYHHAELRARLEVGRRLVTLQQELVESNARLETRVQERTGKIQQMLQLNQELIVGLGHDLRTSITPLVALLPFLAAEETDPERRSSLELCLAPIEYLRRLAERVTEFGRLNSGSPARSSRAVRLRDLAQGALETLADTHRGEPNRVALGIPPEFQVHGEPVRLQAVFEDLLDNAFRFSPPETTITLTAERRDDDALVSVADEGHTLDAQQLERVFDPFVTGDKARHDRRANGLGLTLCRHIVERHGGHIWAEALPHGAGTAFRFNLPLARPFTIAAPHLAARLPNST